MNNQNFRRGDRVEYVGCFVNMRGLSEFLCYSGEGRAVLRMPYGAPMGEAAIESVSLSCVEARP